MKKDKFQAKLEHVWTNLENEAVLLQVNSGEYFSLNPVAAKIWEALKEPQSIQELAEKLATEFSLSLNDCLIDVEEFIAELYEHEFLVRQHE